MHFLSKKARTGKFQYKLWYNLPDLQRVLNVPWMLLKYVYDALTLSGIKRFVKICTNEEERANHCKMMASVLQKLRFR